MNEREKSIAIITELIMETHDITIKATIEIISKLTKYPEEKIKYLWKEYFNLK